MAEEFQVSGSFAGGGTFAGSFTADNAALSIGSVDLTVDAHGLTGVTPLSQSGAYESDLQAWEISWIAFPNGTSGPESSLDLLIPISATENAAGGSVCTIAVVCTDGAVSELRYALSSTDAVSSGTVTPTPMPMAAAPEPSSLALLGTGLVGAVGVLRRRLARR